jgi:sialate O-acetylesterase
LRRSRIGGAWIKAALRVAAGLLVVGSPAHGATSLTGSNLLDELYQEHAVVQRDRPIAVRGHAAAGEGVTVSLAGKNAHARADGSGIWSAVLPAAAAGGPYVLEAQSDSGVQQSVGDILVGDVFLCSGQSNMEMSVERAENSFDEIRTSANNAIRMLTVAHSASPKPLAQFDHPVAWQVAGPQTVGTWSATCFYFARELQKTLHVPLGLVHASWGGTNIRPWISASGFQALGGYDQSLQTLALYAKDQPAAQARFASQWEAWWRAKTHDRAGTEPWSTKSDPRDWQAAPAGLGDWRDWGVPELRAFTGSVWYRTHIKLSTSQAKAATRIDLGLINQVDETWINGRALGNTFGYDAERSYPIAPGVLHAGDNLLVINAVSTYGRGGLLEGGKTRALQLTGGESIALDGPWQYRVVPTAIGYPPRSPWEPIGGVTTLYNAMIAPLGAYGIRGAVWYQGESNADEAESYRGLLMGLMADWRRQFGADLPFVIVQLPNWGHEQTSPGEHSNWARLREAQRQAAAADAHSSLAVTIDIGEPRNLHPTNKQDVGKRLARAARHTIYGEAIAPSGPTAHRAVREADQDRSVAVDFYDVEGGLVAYSHEGPIGFELCGDTPETCRYADATIEGNRVLLVVPRDGSMPTHVRYGWADAPVCTLFDRSGLPAGPFNLAISADDDR